MKAARLSSWILFSISLIMISCTKKNSEGIHYEQKEERPVAMAKILGQEIEMSELMDGAHLEYYQKQIQDYRFKKSRLDHIVREKLLSHEAKKLNINMDEYVEKKILQGPVTVSQSEFDQFIKEKNINAKQMDASARKQIQDFLVTTKREKKINQHLSKLTKSAPIEFYFKRPHFFIPKENIVRPRVGDTGAKIKIIEVIDYQCPLCVKSSQLIENLRKKYGSDIEVSYLYFPGENRVEGRSSAEAAICVFRQKSESFWDFHRSLVGLQKIPDQKEILNLASKVGADQDKLKTCLDKEESGPDLREHFNFANKLGVRSSPLIILNGEVISPDTPLAEIEAKAEEWL